jgi:hypothetical protein
MNSQVTTQPLEILELKAWYFLSMLTIKHMLFAVNIDKAVQAAIRLRGHNFTTHFVDYL